MPKIQRKYILIAALVVAAVLLASFLLTLWEQEKRITRLREENAVMQAELDAEALRLAALEGDLANASSDAYVERLAREELGFVKDGEIKFVKEAKDEASTDEAPTDEPQSTPETSDAPQPTPEGGEPQNTALPE